jgi:hypothetical protein
MTLIKYKINPRKAQSVIEYALLLGIMIAGLIAGMRYLRGLTGNDPQHNAFTTHFEQVRSHLCF